MSENEGSKKQPQFVISQKILCHYDGQLYEGKVTEIDHDSEGYPTYHIHYKGWNKNWDEWVEELRLVPYNQENIQLKKKIFRESQDLKKEAKREEIQKKESIKKEAKKEANKEALKKAKQEAKREAKEAKKEAKREAKREAAAIAKNNNLKRVHSETDEVDATDGEDVKNTKDGRKSSRKRSKIDYAEELMNGTEADKEMKGNTNQSTKEEFHDLAEVHLPIPEGLRRVLLDDCDNVVKSNKLISLPETKTVDFLLKDYLQSIKASPEYEIIEEVISGLEIYFGQALGILLLYRFERPQYLEVLENNNLNKKSISEIYGAEHLLRLFVKLPSLLARTNIDKDSLKILITHLSSFLKYLDENKETIFCNTYEHASPAYIRLALGYIQ